MQKSEPPGAATPGGSLCLLALAVFQFTPLREGRPGGLFLCCRCDSVARLEKGSGFNIPIALDSVKAVAAPGE